MIFHIKKSLSGMQLLKIKGIKEVFVIASPKVELKIRQSKVRVAVLENQIIEPTTLAKEYGWEALVANHNSDETIEYIKQLNLHMELFWVLEYYQKV